MTQVHYHLQDENAALRQFQRLLTIDPFYPKLEGIAILILAKQDAKNFNAFLDSRRMFMLSMATDYSPNVHNFNSMVDMLNGIGNPEPFLRAISDAGFSHVHWCHHWSGDFLYSESEMLHIENLLDRSRCRKRD